MCVLRGVGLKKERHRGRDREREKKIRAGSDGVVFKFNVALHFMPVPPWPVLFTYILSGPSKHLNFHKIISKSLSL